MQLTMTKGLSYIIESSTETWTEPIQTEHSYLLSRVELGDIDGYDETVPLEGEKFEYEFR